MRQRIRERLPQPKGRWHLLAYRSGALAEELRGENVICLPVYRMWRDVLMRKAPPVSYGVQYLAIGNAATAETTRDDQRFPGYLSEFNRFAPIAAPTRGTGGLSYQFQLATSDAVGTWTDIGLWGNGAVFSANDYRGALLTHSLIHYTKDSSTEIILNYTFELG